MFLLLKYLNVFKKNIKIIFVSISIDISAFIIRCLALKNKYKIKSNNNIYKFHKIEQFTPLKVFQILFRIFIKMKTIKKL